MQNGSLADEAAAEQSRGEQSAAVERYYIWHEFHMLFVLANFICCAARRSGGKSTVSAKVISTA